MCWVTLRPKAIELTPEKVLEYLDEIGASSALKADWQARPRRWRERYTKHAKTFLEITPSQPSLATFWTEPVGQPLEIVPVENPTSLQAGESLTVRVLKDGKNLSDFVLSSILAGEKDPTETHATDIQGRATFHFPTPGKWLLRGTELRKSAAADLKWESDFTTLTFEVWPKP